ncbi:hypothetical protein E4U17_005130 [Claviceps sp. LM77 group G4]|nr:hypothetical protein E4U17_005130 [Claviceps sp. LM77 group G4]KAG6072233.1 hypothetical protein E4U16_005549 [Claviceps sp. LM84 group G4]KAG6085382.1 hypothetical protein E4U33_001939 [Claviceps sp. LM78 group G4]
MDNVKHVTDAPAPALAPAHANDPTPTNISKTRPEDFDGNLSTDDEIPSKETIAKVDDYRVLDKHGKSTPFKDLYRGSGQKKRVLVIFIRHFYCGNCQEYLRSLAASITPESLSSLPVSTSIVAIGCGDPALIDMYVETTKWPFDIYTDPTASLFRELGMTKTLALGKKPGYIKKGFFVNVLHSVGQALRSIPEGLALKSGDQRQVGGEFLFEPLDKAATAATAAEVEGEEKKLTWCHRMRTTRDHAEISELMEVLGLEGGEKPN